MKKKLSIIIPMYNSFDILKNNLNKFLSNYNDYIELIVVDDCSNDQSFICAKEFAKKFELSMKVFKNETNMGPNAARNLGISKSSGEYIAFCDSDDWYNENFFEKVIEDINVKKNDLIIIDYNNIFLNKKKYYANYTNKLLNKTKNEIVALCKDSLCLLIIRKKIIENIFLPQLYQGEDAAVVPYIISLCSTFSIITEPLYNYVVRENSASNSFTIDTYRSMLKSYKVLTEYEFCEYRQELEFLGIKNVLYGAILIGLKAKVDKKELICTKDLFGKYYSKWYKNVYIDYLPIYKKLFLFCVKNNLFIFLKIYVFLHEKILK